ncbi:sigma-70 family RNA polymerase sigma factor [Amorphus orientalis]|uniref:RNA polymerase sigma-70 factor (ECF subfamily) n=1 Tax=Amorphus orientalis TaxID=649198 RepID=A0AAE3VPG3_9HYPH|nr:sigma-70 family RNA polymerase sigma factor [Amorphus orientalis]MDQ0315697.1 RNA polymerase sigma-70 factor (ECF subfamily) [Amorphus orientalis]
MNPPDPSPTDSAQSAEARLRAALVACARGDRSGVGEILAVEGRQLLGVARRMLQRNELAEEALQDAMVQIWRKASQFRADDGSARGWIYAVLRNRCLNILRDDRRLSLVSPEDLTAMQDARQEAADPDSWQRIPTSQRLRACLEALDDDVRQCILLAHISGYSHGEIAAIRRLPLGTAKSWIRRGLASLRECLS